MDNHHSRINLILPLDPDILRDFGEFCRDTRQDFKEGVTNALLEYMRTKPKRVKKKPRNSKVKKRATRRSRN
jgi:hypothetical protein